jgi:hypothetical protein
MQHAINISRRKHRNKKVSKTVSYSHQNVDFNFSCNFDSIFINFLQYGNLDWFNPVEWIKAQYDFSDIQMKGILLICRVWHSQDVSLFELMDDYDFSSLNNDQCVFLDNVFKGIDDYSECFILGKLQDYYKIKKASN